MAKARGIEDPNQIKEALRSMGAEEQFMPTLQRFPAGAVELEEGDNPKRIHRLLKKAAERLEMDIACSWDKGKTTLYWAKSKPKAKRSAGEAEAA